MKNKQLISSWNKVNPDMLIKQQILDRILPSTETADIPGLIAKKELENQMKPKNIKSIIYIAAAVVIVMALSITAIATNFFGIRDLVIRDDTLVSGTAPGIAADAVPSMVPGRSNDVIFTQGYPDSAEYKAAEEWKLFCEDYDEDGSISAGVWNEEGNWSNEYVEKYRSYGPYTKEMADKLEEIAAKYDLTLHGAMTYFNAQQFLSAINKSDLLSDSLQHRHLAGGAYEDGTFSFRSEVTMQNGKQIEYWFYNNAKGTLTITHIVSETQTAVFKEWPYETKSGVEVSLALADHQAILIVDLANSFVAVNVMTGTKGNATYSDSDAITEEDLEALADSFDYSVLG